MIEKLLKLKYIIIFLFLLELLFSYFIYVYTQDEVDSFIHNKIESAQVEYDVVYAKLREFSNIVFKSQLDIFEIKEIMKDANSDSVKIQNEVRKKLYSYFLPKYTKFNHLLNIKQVHFHLPDNSSFLRMHNPTKYGDDLSKTRPLVAYVNQHKKKIDSFEEGRIYDGFRFVYPLFNKQQYLGSVEISFSVQAINSILDNKRHSSEFIILRSVIEKKVWKKEAQQHYATSYISPKFLVSQSKEYNDEHQYSQIIKENMTAELKTQINEKILGSSLLPLYFL